MLGLDNHTDKNLGLAGSLLHPAIKGAESYPPILVAVQYGRLQRQGPVPV